MWKTLLSLSLLTAIAAAQPTPVPNVGITGVVQPLPGPTTCAAGSHTLECTGVILQSNTVNLVQYEGQLVKLLGKQVNVTCPLIDVSAVVPPPASLIWCGSPTPGCKLRFKVCPGGLSQFWLFAGLTPGYKPLDPGRGTWLLGDPFVLFASGTGGTAACHEVNVSVPNVPSLIGLAVWLQGARRDIGPVGPVSLTNAICFTITPPMPPCSLPSC